MENKKLSLRDIKGELEFYFNWSANALMPVNPGSTDVYLTQYRSAILHVAQRLLHKINFITTPIYRGILLKENVDVVQPHQNLKYLSFSADRSIAEDFADVNGFGNPILNLETRLGKYGYVIEYTPTAPEVLFHYHFLSLLPYAEAFGLLGMDGHLEVKSLQKQKEIMILQPRDPFTKITKLF